MKNIFLATYCMALLSGPALALAAGTTGGIILTQGAGARAQALGETGAALDGTADALFWNPAGLANAAGVQSQATYLAGMEQSSFQQLLASYSLGQYGTFAIGGSLWQGGALDLDQSDGSFTSVQSQVDSSVSLGYAARLAPGLHAGGAVKLLTSTLLEKYHATAYAADLGVQMAAGENLCLGAAVQNIGPDVTYLQAGDPLPLAMRLGAAYKVPMGTEHRLMAALDAVQEKDREMSLRVGAEYTYAGMISGRVGYKSGYDLEGMTAGLGVGWKFLQLDYAFGLVRELTSTHRVTLVVRL